MQNANLFTSDLSSTEMVNVLQNTKKNKSNEVKQYNSMKYNELNNKIKSTGYDVDNSGRY
jgi:hypothetical protein